MPAPKTTDVISLGAVDAGVVRVPQNYLIYLDVNAVKHAMVWLDNERWGTMCNIGLVWNGSGRKYIPGRFVSHVDLRDVVMGVPTCLECIDRLAEHGA